MKIESQVVSLSLAKKMKELDAPQMDSLFYWDLEDNAVVTSFYFIGMKETEGQETDDGPKHKLKGFCAAYTVGQLGGMLPPHTPTAKRAANDGWICNGHFTGHPANAHQEVADTEADARAKMWIYLKEQNLV